LVVRRNWPSVTQQESVAWAPVQEAIKEYQDPAKADKITKIRRDLDETTEILVRVCE
jgi:synaptobrevin homolog YKT6